MFLPFGGGVEVTARNMGRAVGTGSGAISVVGDHAENAVLNGPRNFIYSQGDNGRNAEGHRARCAAVLVVFP